MRILLELLCENSYNCQPSTTVKLQVSYISFCIYISCLYSIKVERTFSGILISLYFLSFPSQIMLVVLWFFCWLFSYTCNVCL